jgi:copper chaperone NosL
MKKIHLIFAILTVVFSSCSISPQPINYGKDGCSFCKMTIVDKQHAAEIVTDKGKSFKFDAVECMLNYNQENIENPVSLFLINDFSGSGELIDATKATYLISEEIPSPMGAYLSGFESEQKAKDIQEENGGELFNWNELNEHFAK